jgi:hypothetical protein
VRVFGCRSGMTFRIRTPCSPTVRVSHAGATSPTGTRRVPNSPLGLRGVRSLAETDQNDIPSITRRKFAYEVEHD